MDTLLNARFQFRDLLDRHGLVSLAGGEGDAIDWLEDEAVKLANSINRRRRFIKLLREAREMLTREQNARHPDGDSPGGEWKERGNPYVEARGFRKIRVEP